MPSQVLVVYRERDFDFPFDYKRHEVRAVPRLDNVAPLLEELDVKRVHQFFQQRQRRKGKELSPQQHSFQELFPLVVIAVYHFFELRNRLREVHYQLVEVGAVQSSDCYVVLSAHSGSPQSVVEKGDLPEVNSWLQEVLESWLLKFVVDNALAVPSR